MKALYHKKALESRAVIFLILALALFFRFWKICQLPGGLFPDEAANGLDVNSILGGDIHPFYERGNGREALFFYFLTLSVSLFGRGPWQHHIVSAAFGFASVIAAYFLIKKLFGKNVALLTTLFMGVSSYAVTISRTAFRANTVPLLATLTLLFIVQYFSSTDKKTKNLYAILSGAAFALGFYTYTSFRMMLPLLLAFLFLLLISRRGQIVSTLKTNALHAAQFIAAFAIAIAPLALYFSGHPASIVGRAGQVSIFSPDLNHGDVLETFLLVFKKTILSFFTQGDLNWRHNISGEPFLSALLAPFFVLGLVVFTIAIFKLIIQAWQKNIKSETLYQALVASWFWLMLVPEVTTAEGIPHGLRLIGVIPAMFIVPAWAAEKIWNKIKSSPAFLPTRAIIAAAFIGILLVSNYRLYFRVAASSPEYYYAFRSDLTTVSDYLSARNQKAKTYLSLDEFSVQTVDYLTTTTLQPYILLDPANTYQVKLKKGDQVIFTQSTIFDRLKFIKTHPNAKLINEQLNQFGEIIMLVYEQP